MTINISFIWLDKSMRFFLDRTLWILFKPSISAKINLDRSRGAFGTLYQPHVTLKLKVGVFRISV